MTTLMRPDPALYSAWAEAVAEFGDGGLHGAGAWRVVDFGSDRDSFEALLDIVRDEGDTTADPPDGFVHCTYYWITEPAEGSTPGASTADGSPGAGGVDVIGFVALRHSIDTPALRKTGGHIGYSVRPSRRRRGHAKRALGLALAEARELGIEQALLTCDDDNIGSARTIESCGGVFEDVVEGMRRYWVPTAAAEHLG